VEVKFLHGGEPVHMDLDHPVFDVLAEAFESVVGQAPVTVRAGGSIPVVTELAKGGAPVVLTGIGLPDDRLHAPNEKLDLQQLWDGIQVFGRFFELLGETELNGKETDDDEK
jgi:amidohydrolase